MFVIVITIISVRKYTFAVARRKINRFAQGERGTSIMTLEWILLKLMINITTFLMEPTAEALHMHASRQKVDILNGMNVYLLSN